ncbi:MAG: HIT family protein [Erysipelotrichales bacterium]|nr:HIT family protein [Erysipelotrichales bacterium]
MDIFCKIVNGEIPSYKVYEDDVCLAFLDINPVTIGHTVLICKEHYSDVVDANPEVSMHMFDVAKKLANRAINKLNAKGVNILTNCKEAAGQTVPHFHIHIIPRYDETDGYNPIFTAKENVDFEAVLKEFKED